VGPEDNAVVLVRLASSERVAGEVLLFPLQPTPGCLSRLLSGVCSYGHLPALIA